MEVVILCGGKGTRSYPFTDYFPKAMMPIGGTPIIVHLMRTFSRQGLTKFVLAAGHRQEMLRDYFADRFSHWKVDIVDTGDESDTGERIRRCESHVGDTFFVTYADGLGNINLGELLNFHHNSGGLATVTSVGLRSQYGTVQFSNSQQVRSFSEKPLIPDYWINAGYFVFDKKSFQHWRGQSLEADVLPHLADLGLLYTYLHHGFWKSMDTGKDQQEIERIYKAGDPPWLFTDESERGRDQAQPELTYGSKAASVGR
jgi:glucose-1-phosphate cytidylyltransferase